MSCDLSLAETVRVFNRVLKDMNLQFRSIRDRICTIKNKHSNINGSIPVMSISRRVTNGSGLIWVGHGGEHTFKHIFTNKNDKKINANFALMHEMVEVKGLVGGEVVTY